ncbi:MAG: hypothetical protein AAGI37_18820 [Planctomycetota bacterium]
MRPVIAHILTLMALATAGCLPSEQPPARADLDATDTPARVPAIVSAAESDDEAELARLVQALSDKDPAIRLFAIRSLEERTGQTLGYRYYDVPDKRQTATNRWHAWLKDKTAPALARPTNEETTD